MKNKTVQQWVLVSSGVAILALALVTLFRMIQFVIECGARLL